MTSFVELARKPQTKLFNLLVRTYKDDEQHEKGKYVLVRGEAPVLLVAHLDTVHKENVKDVCMSEWGEIIMSPQGIGGDDRCGVYALMQIREKAERKPWLLFTCDEEIGGGGANKFADDFMNKKLPTELDDVKAIIEIDRRGVDDAVYYDCDNKDFEDWVTENGFTTAFGSFTDISIIAPIMGVAAVNLSSGYYNAHTQHEYVVMADLNKTIERAVNMVNQANAETFPRYEYVEAVSTYGYSKYGNVYSWNAYDKYDKAYDKWANYKTGDYGKDYVSAIDRVIDSLPLDIQCEYEDLLWKYDFEELEDYRYEFGNGVIHELYEEEFGKEGNVDWWNDGIDEKGGKLNA